MCPGQFSIKRPTTSSFPNSDWPASFHFGEPLRLIPCPTSQCAFRGNGGRKLRVSKKKRTQNTVPSDWRLRARKGCVSEAISATDLTRTMVKVEKGKRDALEFDGYPISKFVALRLQIVCDRPILSHGHLETAPFEHGQCSQGRKKASRTWPTSGQIERHREGRG